MFEKENTQKPRETSEAVVSRLGNMRGWTHMVDKKKQNGGENVKLKRNCLMENSKAKLCLSINVLWTQVNLYQIIIIRLKRNQFK